MARTIKRAGQGYAVLLAVALVLFAAPGGAQIPGQSDKAKAIGKRLMCMCGCNQILVECNHVGCSVSTAMLKELDERLARNEPEDLLIQSFVQQYGEKVLAQPPAKNFGLVAWIMPFFILLLGFFIMRAVLIRWRNLTPSIAGVPGAESEISPAMLERARREMELADDLDGPATKAGKD
ncbi:MAG: cytochrome c-type biogenesis protein CcmH [Acidobacteria bacterium]|nr:cytochrome c-type biogenesis protein CcmH [Acidobacteriota bacterium]MCL5288876.1 cytochrome c-type biogenesis protein CcmH [Acidobacteriota bacterium]